MKLMEEATSFDSACLNITILVLAI